MGAETDIQFEVWQDGHMVASADSLFDAQHYMVIYGQDGSVEAKTAITTRFPGFNTVSAAASPVVPAPEEEASLWGCADGNGIDPRLVFRDRPTAEQVAADTNMVVQPLYASPVVPVEVSREEIARIIDPVTWRRFDRFPPYASDVPHETAVEWCGALQPSLEKTDAILAALRPTDTGREA